MAQPPPPSPPPSRPAFADVYTGLYSDTYGVAPALPSAAAAVNLAGTWTDATPDVFAPGSGSPAVTITRGRPDEISQTAPAAAALTLNNRSGKYSPRNPTGRYYGLFGRNTPLRVSVGAAEPYLRLENDTTSGASCPDTAALEITGTIDLRLDLNLSSYLPCVLASKWAATTGGALTGTPGTLVGATNNDSVYGSPTQVAGALTLDGIVGRPIGINAQKVYFNASSFPAPVDDHKGLMAAKCQLWLCYRPTVNGSDAAGLLGAITQYLNYAISVGAPQPKVILWQEPQNSQFHLTPALLGQCFTNYYAQIKALPGSPAVVYDSASHLGEAAVRTWYPGDTVCDEVAQDLYGYNWKHGGVTLTTLQQIANAASPKKPVTHAEMGTALSAKTAALMTQQDVTDFFTYVQGVFTARATAGLPNGAVMWFNGLGNNWNTFNAGDFRIPLMRALYDALQPSSGGGASAGRSWALTLNGDGTLTFWWTTDGTLATLRKATSTVPIPLGRTVLRVYGSASSPASVTFWTAGGGNAGAPGNAPVWQQLGAAVPLAGLQLAATTAPLQIGYNSAFTADQAAYGGMAGQVFEFQLQAPGDTYRDVYGDVYGAGSGPGVAADPGFPVPGAASFTDRVGNVWQLTGNAEISGADYRFHGELASLPTTWDPAAIDVQVPVTAGGLLRRLSQGSSPPVASALKRAVLSRTGALAPVAYWPGEDPAGAPTAGPAVGPSLLTWNTAPQFAGDSAFACSLPIPVLGNSAGAGPVAPYAGGTAAVVRFLLHVPAGATIADDTVLLRANTTGTVGDLTLRFKAGGQLRLTGYSAAAEGYAFDTGALAQFSVTGALLLVSLELTVAPGFAAPLKYAVSTLAAGSTVPVTAAGTAAGAPGNVVTIHPGASGLGGTSQGHWFVQAAYEPLGNFASPLAAWAGETAANRFARLCGENGVGARVYGYPATDVPMGAQSPDTLTNLLQLCETTGRGLLYEPRQALALGYRTVKSLCQQAPAVTLDASLGHLDSFPPTDDDQQTRNDVTVANQGGASARAVLADGSPLSTGAPPNGTGDYATSATVNAAADAQLRDIAGWILNIGTVNQERYPAVAVDLMNGALASLLPRLQALDIGGFLSIVNPPVVPPGGIRQLVYGAAEAIGTKVWQMTFNCVPEAPYETGIFGDPVFGRLNTDGSVLDADIGTGDTTFAVDITGLSGIPWTTAPGDFPFDILMGGEQMTVTGIVTLTSTQQQFTVIRSVNGVVKTHFATEPLSLAHPAIVALA